MTIERDLKGKFIKGGTKNQNSYTWDKDNYPNRKGLTKKNNKSVLQQSKTLSKTWKKQLKEGRTTSFIKGHKINLGKTHSTETKKKISLKLKGKPVWNKGLKNIYSKKTKKKMRISAFKYIMKTKDILWPRIGHNEKQILDKLEKELNIKILRQYKCEGYFIDGYIKEINVAIEIDEIPKIKEKDIDREKIIKNKLNCKFMRINDFD